MKIDPILTLNHGVSDSQDRVYFILTVRDQAMGCYTDPYNTPLPEPIFELYYGNRTIYKMNVEY